MKFSSICWNNSRGGACWRHQWRRILPPLTPFVIEASGVNHAYEGQHGWVRALEGFEISIPRNEFLCLLGPSGCGKSSFLRIVSGLMKPIEGEVKLNGKRIEQPGLDRGIVFQEPALFPWLTALRNVAFGLEMSGMDKQAVNERAAHVLRIVGLERAMHLYPYQLSGGMKHRVAVARAWALQDASVLLMDEPFSAIDAVNRMTLQKYLVDAWLEEPRTVIYVTHDIDEAVYLADRIAIMTPSPGRIGQYVTVDMERPRDRNSAEANELRNELTEIMHRLGSPLSKRRNQKKIVKWGDYADQGGDNEPGSIAGGFLLSASACMAAPRILMAADAPDTVRFGVLHPNLTTVIHEIAKRTGAYERHNLKVVETRFKSGQTVEGVEQLWRGNLDFYMGGAPEDAASQLSRMIETGSRCRRSPW